MIVQARPVQPQAFDGDGLVGRFVLGHVYGPDAIVTGGQFVVQYIVSWLVVELDFFVVRKHSAGFGDDRPQLRNKLLGSGRNVWYFDYITSEKKLLADDMKFRPHNCQF